MKDNGLAREIPIQRSVGTDLYGGRSVLYVPLDQKLCR